MFIIIILICSLVIAFLKHLERWTIQYWKYSNKLSYFNKLYTHESFAMLVKQFFFFFVFCFNLHYTVRAWSDLNVNSCAENKVFLQLCMVIYLILLLKMYIT